MHPARIVPSRRALAALAAGAASLAPAAPALAADVAAVDRVPFVTAGPAISGERIAYAESDGRGGSIRFLGATIGATPSELFARAAPENPKVGSLNGVGVALTPTRTAFAFGEDLAVDPDGATAYQQAYAGPPAGPFAPIAGTPDGDQVVVDHVDASGDAVLTVERTSSAVRAFVRDLAAGTPPKQVGGDGVRAARIAGPYVAVATSTSDTVTRVTVSDWRTDAVLYAVDVPVTAPYGFGFGLDVQEDGTIAVRAANPASTGSKPKVDLAWASAAQPTLHVLATDVGTQLTRISGGRILFERAKGTLARELVLADLAGTVTPVSFPLDTVMGADLDGTRMTFATPTCVYAGDVPATAPAVAPPGVCPQASTRLGTARSKTRGRVVVEVSCVMATAAGCRTAVALQTPKAKNRRTLTLATRTVTVPAGTSRRFGVTMSAKRLRDLRARVGRTRRTAIVDVIARVKDDAGLTSSTRRDASVRLR